MSYRFGEDPIEMQQKRASGQGGGTSVVPAPRRPTPEEEFGGPVIPGKVGTTHLAGRNQAKAYRQGQYVWEDMAKYLQSLTGPQIAEDMKRYRAHDANETLKTGVFDSKDWMQGNLEQAGVNPRLQNFGGMQTLGQWGGTTPLGQWGGSTRLGQWGGTNALNPMQERQALASMQARAPIREWSGKVNLREDPSYQWRFDEGLKAARRSANARSGVNSGATLKALTKYGQDMAANEYDAAFNRALTRYTTNRGTQQLNRQMLMEEYLANRDTGRINAQMSLEDYVTNRDTMMRNQDMNLLDYTTNRDTAMRNQDMALRDYTTQRDTAIRNQDTALRDFTTQRDTTQMNNRNNLASWEANMRADQQSFNNVQGISDRAIDVGFRYASQQTQDAQRRMDNIFRSLGLGIGVTGNVVGANNQAASAMSAAMLGGLNMQNYLEQVGEQSKQQMVGNLIEGGAVIAGLVANL